ncbi:MAG: hypothetical protein EOP85_21955 [Verrucomicrobiaceae bacterium]|nr:MAG: hypothetical protein EOP85_21955 [Verrucomicrobiaceae bacterium]
MNAAAGETIRFRHLSNAEQNRVLEKVRRATGRRMEADRKFRRFSMAFRIANSVFFLGAFSITRETPMFLGMMLPALFEYVFWTHISVPAVERELEGQSLGELVARPLPPEKQDPEAW